MDGVPEDESDGTGSSSEGSSDSYFESPDYENFLHRLAQNDPSETVIDFSLKVEFVSNLVFDNEKILELGRNLQGNTFVTEMALPLAHLRDSDDEEGEKLTPMLHFIAQSPVLNAIRFDVEGANRSIIDRFFTATQRSGSHIQELALAGLQPPQFEAFSSLLRELGCLKTLNLEYCTIGDTDESTERFATAIGNVSTLESFVCGRDIGNLEVFLERLPPNLKDLVLRGVSLGNTTESFQRLVAAISNKRSLESFCCIDPSLRHPRSFDHLVERLHVHPYLKKLVLSDDTNALRHLQQMPPMLANLKLGDFVFRGEDAFRPVYQGLCSSSTVTKLTVCHCTFDDTATSLFTEMLQPTEGTGCAIRSLHLDVDDDNDLYGMGNMFSRPIGQILGSVFASCSKLCTNHQLEVIECMDSHVQEDGRYTQKGRRALIHELGANAPSITLRSLSLRIVTWEELQLLGVCLPKLIHLKELELQCHFSANTEDAKRDFISGLRRNGSLESVDVLVLLLSTSRPFFTEEELSKVETYCSRNKALPTVIVKPSLDGADSNDKRTPIALYPRLFHQTLQCPATGVGWSLAGLLAVSDGFGPVLQNAGCDRDLKRPALLDFEEGPDRKQSRE